MYEAGQFGKGVLKYRKINFFSGPGLLEDKALCSSRSGAALRFRSGGTSAVLGEDGRSRYHVGMAQRRFAQAMLLLLPFTLLCGCKPRPKNTPVVVHVLRNLNSIYGSELDRRLLDFQGSNPRLSTGQLIVIQSATGDYKDMLQKQTSSSENIDFIILDSPDDANSNPALQIAMTHAVNICAGLKACPTNIPSIIPPQIKGNEQEAALVFQNALQKAP
jgi:hypothetical protein